MHSYKLNTFIFSGVIFLSLFVMSSSFAYSFFGLSSDGDDGSSYDTSDNYENSYVTYSNTDTGESDTYGTWTVNDDGFGNTTVGNYTAGGGYDGSSGGNSPYNSTEPVTMCVVGGCTTCSRNVYEPCPTVTPTYTQSSYYSQSSYYIQSAYEDTPDIGTEDPTAPRVNLYIKKQGTAGWSKNLQVSPEDEVSLRWVTINTNQCQSTDTTEFTVSDTSGTSGNTDTVNEQATGLRVYEIACQGTNGARVTSPASLTILATPLTFTATPRIVRTNETSKLIWNVYGRTGCTIAKKANNTDLSTVSISAGERDTQPLTGETTYLLSCPDGASAETTIRVLPIISET